MECMVRVEGHRSVSRSHMAGRMLRVIALAALATAITACGGGGSGGDDGGGGGGGGNPPPATGQVEATVLDEFDTPIGGATVTATIGTTSQTATTGADGKGTATQVPTGSVSVTATAPGFLNSAAQGVTVSANATATATFRLQRVAAQAAGGVLTVLPVGTLDPQARTYTFTMRVVVVDENFQPVSGLTDASFSLADCTPVTVGSSLPECVRGGNLTHDKAYTVDPTPPGVQSIAAGPARPYAAAMLLDQSGSINGTDPTDARVFSTKVFLDGLDSNDSVLLAAFASEGIEGGTDVQLPEIPVTFYPCTQAPCAPPAFEDNGLDLFASVDSLANTVGGSTPMYDSLEVVIDATADNAPTGVPDQRLAVVMFSDGMDTTCGFATCVPRRNRRDRAGRRRAASTCSLSGCPTGSTRSRSPSWRSRAAAPTSSRRTRIS